LTEDSGIDSAALRERLAQVIGPAPWYWQTFPPITTSSGQRFAWQHHGDQGALAYIVSLATDGEAEKDKARLALNTYCRAFPVAPDRVGVWCPEGRNLRFTCFDPEHLKPFDIAEIAGWFKQSADRIYSTTEPLADFEVPLQLSPGTHKIDVPEEFRDVEELIVPTTYAAKGIDDPAMALFVFYFHGGLVEVLPQRWFTAAQYKVGPQWITRAARDPESLRIFGECFGAGSFLLQEDGVRLERWIQKAD
jgi:hypothetical protein